MSSDIFKAFHGFYKQIGKENRLHNRIEPFPTLFWALGILLAHILQQVTQPAGLESRNHGTGTVLYTAGVSQVQFDGRSAAANPFPLLLYFLYGSIVCILYCVHILYIYQEEQGALQLFQLLFIYYLYSTVYCSSGEDREGNYESLVWRIVELSDFLLIFSFFFISSDGGVQGDLLS